MNYLMTRRSCRRFEDRPVEREKIEALLRAGMQAPSGKDARPWQFLVLTEREKLVRLSESCPFSVAAAKAPGAILLLADFQKEERDVMWWPQCLAACAENMLLQAEMVGLGAVWLGLWPVQERVDHCREVFSLPADLEPFAAIAFGYKAKEKPPEDRWDPTLVHWGELGCRG